MSEYDPWQAPPRVDPSASSGQPPSPYPSGGWNDTSETATSGGATATATATAPQPDWSAPWLGGAGDGGSGGGDHGDPFSGDGAHAQRRNRKPVAMVVAAAVVAGAAGVGIAFAVNGGSSPTATTSTSPANVQAQSGAAPATSGSTDVHTALAKISPSVVLIKSQVQSSSGFGGVQQGTASGPGIIISKDGEVVTNAHVVAGATQTTVTIAGQNHDATILGSDASADLAVLKVSGVSNLTPAVWATNSTVHVGDSVIAVGNAEGYGGTPSVSQGIVSALGRSISDETSNLTGLIQTDAAINPGNSGGPLVDTAGRVIGITTAVERGTTSEPAQGIGFAIASDTVVKNIAILEKGGGSSSTGGSSSGTTTNTGYLGVNLADGPTGPVITQVQDSSPAATAGLQVDDVIQKVDNTDVSDPTDLTTVIRSHKPGDTVTLTIVRNGSVQTVKITLAKRPTTGG